MTSQQLINRIRNYRCKEINIITSLLTLKSIHEINTFIETSF